MVSMCPPSLLPVSPWQVLEGWMLVTLGELPPTHLCYCRPGDFTAPNYAYAKKKCICRPEGQVLSEAGKWTELCVIEEGGPPQLPVMLVVLACLKNSRDTAL